MSLDKAVQYGKEHRKPYRGAKAVDRTCRNHGSDKWSQDDRMIGTLREKAKRKFEENEVKSECQPKEF